MLSGDRLVLPAAALAEAKNFLRIVGSQEDSLAMQALLSAAELCEQFTRQALVVRSFTETIGASPQWTRLSIGPVRAIEELDEIGEDGVATAMATGDYAIDIDASGDGWVRVSRAGSGVRAQVRFQAGIAIDWESVPEALKLGVLRLAAHLFSERGQAAASPPAAVTALWQPWRRMRLA